MGGDSPPAPAQPAAPAPAPSPSQSYTDMMEWNITNAPRVLASKQEYDPQFAAVSSATSAQTAEASVKSYLDLFRTYGSDIAAANREASITADPYGQQRKDYIDGQLASGGQGDTEIADRFRAILDGPSQDNSLIKAVRGRAASDLALGSSLDDASAREVQQGVRAGQTARGLSMGPDAVYAEAMALGSAGEARRQQRFSNAMGAAQLGLTSDTYDLESKSNLTRALGTEKQQGFANINSLLGMNAPARLGETTGAFGAGYAPNATGAGFGLADMNNWQTLQQGQNSSNSANFATSSRFASDIFGSQSSYAAATYESPFNMALSAAKAGAGIGMMAAGCWVAREVYGVENLEWVRFRKWLYTRAPRWFVRAYEKFGPSFAAWLHKHPTLKAPIRAWMDRRILSLQLA